MQISRQWFILVVTAAGFLANAAHAQWTNAALLNLASEGSSDVKNSVVIASKNGGFHAAYVTGAGLVQYRRYNGTLSPVVTASSGFFFNPSITEALNGDVHIFYEDWNGDTPEVGWVRSTNGGVSFSPKTEISVTGGGAKFPIAAPFGMGSGSEVLMSYWNAGSQQFRFNRFNGTSWTGDQYVGQNIDNEYQVHGIARSPVDGTTWRGVSIKSGSSFFVGLKHYTGTTWEPTINLSGSVFFARQKVAVNDAGQVMVLWDDDGVYYSMLYTPGAGAGPRITVTTQGSWGTSLCAIPGTNNFYTAYPKNGPGRLYGRRWSGGAWMAEEQISQGLADEFTVGPSVSADPNGSGTIYATWEYWGTGTGKPQQFYAIRGGLPPGPKGTISGVVRDQFNVPVVGAVVTVFGIDSTLSAAGGTYSLQVPAGTYTVDSSKQYYTGQSVPNVNVVANQTTTANFNMTLQAPGTISTITASAGNTTNTLNWTNPNSGSVVGTVIRFRTDGVYPTGPTDGTLAVDDVAGAGATRSFTHTGLTNGVTYRYRAFPYTQDASRVYAGGTNANPVTPAVKADFDRDGDVDVSDFGLLQRCLTGNGVGVTDANCTVAKLDADDDIDAADMNLLLGCMVGPKVYASPTCIP